MAGASTVTCPAGHASTTTDYCDTCGAPIGAKTKAQEEAEAEVEAVAAAAGEPGAAGATGAGATGEGGAGVEAGAGAEAAAPEAAGETRCPECGEVVLARFCESCGYDVEAGVPAAAAPLTLVLGADKAHWDRMVGSGEPAFPAEAPTLTLLLDGERAMLGRIRSGAPVDVDLPLTGAAADPAVSHHQCEFVRDGGSWTVRDAGSSNGTWVNDATAPLAEGATHTLAPGDRIFVGAWTCLAVQPGPATPPAAPAAGATPTPTPTPTP
jgi:hypothetical protein